VAKPSPGTTDTRASGTAPFVLLIMVLLTGGLVATLWLSTAAAADSYRLDEARQVARDLSEQSERLHRDVEAAQSAPALAAAARAQGMVPAGEPAVLVIAPDGSSQVVGDPKPAQPIAPPPSVAVPATPPAADSGAQINGAQAATDGQPAPAPAGAAAAEDQLVAVPDATPDTTPDPANSETTPDSAAAADDASPAAP
jgi:cell division protein FtsI (penicillin-binding protein 3)